MAVPGGDEDEGNQSEQEMKREARGHERHHALSEQDADLVDDPSDGQKDLQQGGYLGDSGLRRH